jgi:uncharacterized protein
VKCPMCERPVQPRPQNQYAPFCSQRCRMADLSKWLSGDYAIPGPPADPSEHPAGNGALKNGNESS